MRFSDSIWEKTAPIYNQIIRHPFNAELAQGTLDRERFVFYVEQDAYYLKAFSRSLAFIAARAGTSPLIHQFLNYALGVLIGERELHAKFSSSGNWDNLEPTPACLAYTQFLIATAATAPLEEAIAAVLPCFWIYREVGLNIAANTIKNNPYHDWIETYSSVEFSEGTDRAIATMDEIASQSTAKTVSAMEKAFEYSSLFEWHFWDDAYHMIKFKDAYLQKCSISSLA